TALFRSENILSGAAFHIEKPEFAAGVATFRYTLQGLTFTETLTFQDGWDPETPASAAFRKLLDLAAVVLGTSYFKLTAPLTIRADAANMSAPEQAFGLDVYENGMGEFYARNGVHRFGKIELIAPPDDTAIATQKLGSRALLPIGGGKASLVSVSLLRSEERRAGAG